MRGNGEILSQVVSSQVKIVFIRFSLRVWLHFLLNFVLYFAVLLQVDSTSIYVLKVFKAWINVELLRPI